MNKARRKLLTGALNLLEQAADIVYSAKCDEEDAQNNLPENLQDSERYDLMENAIDKLDDALADINEAKNYIGEAIA